MAKQGLPPQLKDHLAYAEQKGLKFQLFLPKGATVTRELRALIDDGKIVRLAIP